MIGYAIVYKKQFGRMKSSKKMKIIRCEMNFNGSGAYIRICR